MLDLTASQSVAAQGPSAEELAEVSELQEENQLLAQVLAQLLANQQLTTLAVQLTTEQLTLSSAPTEQAIVADVAVDPVRAP